MRWLKYVVSEPTLSISRGSDKTRHPLCLPYIPTQGWAHGSVIASGFSGHSKDWPWFSLD